MRKIYYIFFILFFLTNLVFPEEDYQRTDPALAKSIEGMRVYEKAYEALMDNTVNSNTPGYKEIGVANQKTKNGLENVYYYKYTQGIPINSGGSLDFLIQGSGFFVLQFAWGKGYTRDGRFTLDEVGRLVSFGNNAPVLGENGEIYITKGKVSISEFGTIAVAGEIVDVIKIVDFKDSKKLKSLNGSIFYFENPEDEVYLDKNFKYSLKQGYYESSNANMTDQLTKIPIIKNVYDANTKAVKLIIKSINAGVQLGNPQ